MHSTLTEAGRIVFALPFAVFGVLHLMAGPDMAGLVPGWLPAPTLWIYLVGLAFLAASVSFLIGKMVRQAGIALALLLASFVLTIKIPGMMNPDTFLMAMANGLKDLALAGGALLVAGTDPGEAKAGSTEAPATPTA
jgi:putative oxidoreductase